MKSMKSRFAVLTIAGLLGAGTGAVVATGQTQSGGICTSTERGTTFPCPTTGPGTGPSTGPTGCQGETTDRDSNGDLHSNCHTGSKGRGAGGEDKASR